MSTDTTGTEAVAAAFNQLCRESPVLRTTAAELAAGKYRWEGVNSGYLPRPVFAPLDGLRSFAEDVLTVLRVTTRLPQRLFDGDLDRYCAFLGIDERRAACLRRLDTAQVFYGRADAYHDGTGFKLLETGLTSSVGGVEQTMFNPRRWLSLPEVDAFARHHGLGHASAVETVARLVRQAAGTIRPGGEPVIVLTEGPGALAEHGYGWWPLRAALRELDIDCRVAELDDLRLGRDRLLLRTDSGEIPVDVVVRCFNSHQVLAHPDGTTMLETVARAHEEGLAVFWSPLSTELFSDKGCLALLSDPHRQAADHEERSAIDRIVPWTRLLTADGGPAQDELLGECRARRTELIIKPSVGYGGHGVVAGWECDQRRWDAVLKQAARGSAIVQGRVTPKPEPVFDPRTDRDEPWDVVHGIFYSPAGYTGSLARAVPTGTSAVINLATNPDTRLSAVFHHGGEEGGSACPVRT